MFRFPAQTDSRLPTGRQGESECGLGRECVGSPSGLRGRHRMAQVRQDEEIMQPRRGVLVSSSVPSIHYMVTLPRMISNIWLWTWQDVVQWLGKSRAFLSQSLWMLPAGLSPYERGNQARIRSSLFSTLPSEPWLWSRSQVSPNLALQDFPACLWLPESSPVKIQLPWGLAYAKLQSKQGDNSWLSGNIASYVSNAFKVFPARSFFSSMMRKYRNHWRRTLFVPYYRIYRSTCIRTNAFLFSFCYNRGRIISHIRGNFFTWAVDSLLVYVPKDLLR